MPDIITMPAELYNFAALRFNLATINTKAEASAFNPFSRVDGPSLELWQVEMTLNPMTGDDLDSCERFLSALRGGKVLCRIYDQRRVAGNGRTQPQGAGGSGPVINVAAVVAAGDESATFKNLLTSEAIALKSMDQFQVGENLYRVQDSGPSDGSGEGTFSFRPAARFGWAIDDPITLVQPTGLFRLTSGEMDFGVGRSLISEPFTLSFTEEPDFA